ncbi:MAG: tRNA pseudouridine(38-40) synthase TruA [Chlorobiaceae bacterium]|nr:tRNA pseudouridine(38-40) synthase TruA [Chlorobiaceae bacterium]NTW62568.1 tRNA pseudouridine(38-40) synthase TruA [Chlorobiaceae bacterium]
MKNIRITIEYDGTGYAGWQRQAGSFFTVQGEIERILSQILQEDIHLDGAGRTDKGVHARAQVATFRSNSFLEPDRMVHSMNALLPKTIRVSEPLVVPDRFHARHSAREREYRYFVREEPSAVLGRFSGCSCGALDLMTMNRVASYLVGEHDFSVFSKEPRDRTGCLCRVVSCKWFRQQDFFVLRISANRFLRSMVRYLVALMIESGKGLLSPEEAREMIESGVLTRRLVPAAPSGLFLWKITYESDSHLF